MLMGALLGSGVLWLTTLLLLTLAWHQYDSLKTAQNQAQADLDAQIYANQNLHQAWQITQRFTSDLEMLRTQSVLGDFPKQRALDQLEHALQHPGIWVSRYALAAEAPAKDLESLTLQQHQLVRHRVSLEGLALHEERLVGLIEQLARLNSSGLTTIESCTIRIKNPLDEEAPLEAEHDTGPESGQRLPLNWRCTLDWYRFAPSTPPSLAGVAP